ncbi:disease resistance protein RPV1 [Trifolium repens]|nr:disease resistance protein RPV1 [Trifolium repens]
MGGIGKTTIARYMFVKRFAHYDSVWFMEKVQEESEKLGLTNVRTKIFRKLLKREISASVDVGDAFIKRWLRAFKQSHPQQGYEGLLERAVEYAGGVPLALKVLGSHFHSRSPEFWKFELDYLEDKGEGMDEIQEVLQVSYNGLTRREKEIFLDIAFFFEGENKDFATAILDACGFGATSGIQILEDKALVTISSNRIQMHDLLQKMAFNIVGNDQRLKHSRLTDIEEIHHALKNNKGADVVEGILFDLSQKENLHINLDTFEWNGYLPKSLPHDFCAKLLVEIHLPHSNVEYLWHGIQELRNLEAINLSECKDLINLPDLSQASKLKWLYLSGCESFCEIQPSIFSKDTLVTLLVDRCKNLKIPENEKDARSPQKINVYGCSSLKEFSLSLDSIENWDISNTGVEILHSSVSGMSKLGWLNLEGLELSNLPNKLSCLELLTELRISYCDIVTKLKLEGIFDGLGSLRILYLKHCGNFLELPSSMMFLSQLEILCLTGCARLHPLPGLPLEIEEFVSC